MQTKAPGQKIPVYNEALSQRSVGVKLPAEHDFAYHWGRSYYENKIQESQHKKRKCLQMIVFAIILTLAAFIIKGLANCSFEKVELKGAVSVGFLKDNGFLKGSCKTEEALEKFYKETGIPLFLYIIVSYPADSSTYNVYTEELYDTLFADENHALFVYYANADQWGWVAGNAVENRMTSKTFNSLVDAFYFYWKGIMNDEVFAKGIKSFIEDFTGKSLLRARKRWSMILWVVAAGMLLHSSIFYLLDIHKIRVAGEALEHLKEQEF